MSRIAIRGNKTVQNEAKDDKANVDADVDSDVYSENTKDNKPTAPYKTKVNHKDEFLDKKQKISEYGKRYYNKKTQIIKDKMRMRKIKNTIKELADEVDVDKCVEYVFDKLKGNTKIGTKMALRSAKEYIKLNKKVDINDTKENQNNT